MSDDKMNVARLNALSARIRELEALVREAEHFLRYEAPRRSRGAAVALADKLHVAVDHKTTQRRGTDQGGRT